MKKFLISLIFISSSLFAKEIVWLGRSPRALLMGDAWTTLANDDEMTLFYNPASLGANSSVGFNLINPRVAVTNALDELDRFENFPSSDAAAISDRLLGFPVFAEASIFPTFKMLNFAFSMFATTKTSISLNNEVHPSLDIDYRYDRGFAFGFGFNLMGGKNSRGKKLGNGERLSVGYTLKYLRREGLDRRFDLFGTGLLDDINNGSLESTDDFKNILGFSEGKSFGHDLGIEYALSSGASQFTAGASLMNIGDISFKKLSGTQAVPEQDMYLNLGASYRQDFKLLSYTISTDLKPINQPIPFGQMFNFGASVSIPLVTGFFGWSQGYISYGVEVDVWPVSIIAGFYSVELGSEFRENEGKRAMIYISLLDIDIDAF